MVYKGIIIFFSNYLHNNYIELTEKTMQIKSTSDAEKIEPNLMTILARLKLFSLENAVLDMKNINIHFKSFFLLEKKTSYVSMYIPV